MLNEMVGYRYKLEVQSCFVSAVTTRQDDLNPSHLRRNTNLFLSRKELFCQIKRHIEECTFDSIVISGNSHVFKHRIVLIPLAIYHLRCCFHAAGFEPTCPLHELDLLTLELPAPSLLPLP